MKTRSATPGLVPPTLKKNDDISDEVLAADNAVFAHLDDAGFKFVMPAVMRWSLKPASIDKNHVAEFFAMKLLPESRKAAKPDVMAKKWKLTKEQIIVIAEWLEDYLSRHRPYPEPWRPHSWSVGRNWPMGLSFAAPQSVSSPATHAPVAKRSKAPVLHAGIPPFEIGAGVPPIIKGREPEWRGPRPITEWQKVRILLYHQPNEDHHERPAQTRGLCRTPERTKPGSAGHGIFNPSGRLRPSSRAMRRRFEPSGVHGHLAQLAERLEFLISEIPDRGRGCPPASRPRSGIGRRII